MNVRLLFGLFCSAVIVVFFLWKGRKNDIVSLLGVVVGVGVILLLFSLNWGTLSHLLPGNTAQAVSVAPALPAIPRPTQRVALPAIPTAHPIVKQSTPHTPQTKPASATRTQVVTNGGTVLSYTVGFAFCAVMLLLVIVVTLARGRRRSILTDQPSCSSCGQSGRLQAYPHGRRTSMLCTDCVGRLQVTSA